MLSRWCSLFHSISISDLPLAFLQMFCCSLGFYSASRWCGQPRPSSSQLLPVRKVAKSQPRLVLIVNGPTQEVPVNRAPSSLSAPIAHTNINFSILSAISPFTLNTPPLLPGEANTLPFSHMLLMFRMLSVTTGRSTAPERGERDSLFSLCTNILKWKESRRGMRNINKLLQNTRKMLAMT